MDIKRLREILEDMVCRTHNRSATIIFTGDQFIIEKCCCERFENILINTISHNAADEFGKDVNDDRNFDYDADS